MFKKYSLYAIILIVIVASFIVVFPAVASVFGVKNQFQIRQGLDLQGGTQLAYETDLTKVKAGDQDSAVSSLVEVIRRRVDSLGVAEPTIQKTRDNSRVIVELPGIKDIDQALALIGATAQLEFREGIEGKSLENGQIKSENYDDWQTVGLDGARFSRAAVEFSQGKTAVITEPVISIKFDAEGKKIFAEVTGRNINKPLAIFLDKVLLSAPTVQGRIDSDTAQITGQFDLQSAKQLANQLNAGALPVPIKIISQNNIGASLGTESVQKSILAGLIGLLLVILFMLIYYRLPGFLASIALILYAIITMALFMGINVTLTLAGIAGFILSVGMAIDANILIFERMKEELRSSVPLKAAIEAGYRRAWSSIRDSNISSLITSVILYYFGSSLIRGFALTLGLGILVSMFTAMTITHVMLQWAANSRLKNRLNWWAGGIPKTN